MHPSATPRSRSSSASVHRAAAELGPHANLGVRSRADARLDPALVGARRAMRMATIDGARALGWDDEIGSLEAGKQADFVLFDLDHHEWTPYADPLQALVWSASAASIAQTWVAGRPLYTGGRVITLDESELRAEARERPPRSSGGPASTSRRR
jgi:cytosine/adenosine deaminase-related metal-dependent hydrolase